MRSTLAGLFAPLVIAAAAHAQSTAFTYQGDLRSGGAAPTGVFDFRFRLFDAATVGTQIGATVCVNNVQVAGGLFTTTIDFGQQFASISARHLEIEVRQDTGLNCTNAGGFTVLSPRQTLSPTPRASAANVANALSAPDGSPSSAVFVDNAGNVGIGTTAPAGPLHVNGTMFWGGLTSTFAYSGVDSSGLFLEQKGTSAINSRMRLQSSRAGDQINYSQFNIDPANGFSFMPIGTGNGNVGIGTTTPAYPLHVNGALAVSTTAGNQADALVLGIERSWAFRQEGTGSATALKLQSIGGGGNKNFLIDTTGFVGIGTLAPSAKLHVAGTARFDLPTFTTNVGVHDPFGNLIWKMGHVFDSSGTEVQPAVTLVSQISGDALAGFHRGFGSGGGRMFADQKNFRVPNPADVTTDIWYCCPEGPEAAMYIRGTGRLMGGQAVIELPGHFQDLAVERGMTVQVTPLSAASKGLAIVRKSLSGIAVVELSGGAGNYEFDWRVEAVRRGHEDYQVIRPWMRSDADEAKAWNNRLKWIAERHQHGAP